MNAFFWLTQAEAGSVFLALRAAGIYPDLTPQYVQTPWPFGLAPLGRRPSPLLLVDARAKVSGENHCQNPYSRHFDLTEFQAIAAEAYSALDTGHQIAPFFARLSAFDFDDAYHVAACNKADARDARRSCDTFLHSD